MEGLRNPVVTINFNTLLNMNEEEFSKLLLIEIEGFKNDEFQVTWERKNVNNEIIKN